MMIIFGNFISNTIDEQQAKYDALPDQKGTVVSEISIRSPLGGKKASLVRFKGDCSYRSSNGPRSTTWHSYDRLNFFADDARIVIDGKSYKIKGNIKKAYIFGGLKTRSYTNDKNIDEIFYGHGDCLDKVLFDEERSLLSGPVPDKPKYYSSSIDEYCYDSGDEIRFKGKIEGDSVILYSQRDEKKVD
ncbi:MAG: hypothetical protein GY714_07055 [Desulfobacterales bacterium]|nr:hypothetical protein [Desulfobacterales bacterium]